MNEILIVGVIITAGFVFGELAGKLSLPKVTGYIVAGIVLSPDLFSFIPASFVEGTDVVTQTCLSIITFSVGGTLLLSKMKSMGQRILCITVFESTFAFFFVMAGFLLLSPFFLKMEHADYINVYLPFALMIAALAAPTDPTATLAVAHEYGAKGPVMSSVMGVAAFDDAVGIMLYSVAITFAAVFVSSGQVEWASVAGQIAKEILGALMTGALAGWIFNKLSDLFFDDGTEGMIIVLVVGFLTLCYGISHLLGVDELLAVMFMGFVVVNFNHKSELIFKLLERYTEQLVFVLFFTVSGMHLDVFVLAEFFPLVLVFVFFRALGKYLGTWTGALKGPAKMKKYTAFGLIPQGGIVIGLALMIPQKPEFSMISSEFINIILGATVVHELAGPVLAKFALKRAGEI